MIIPEVNAGFEVVSHGAVHASITSAEVLRVGWFALEGVAATLIIDQAGHLSVIADGKERCAIDLMAQPYISMGGVVRLLRGKGLRAELVSLSHEKIPAHLLAPVQEQDIFFAKHNVGLVIDTRAFMQYMLSESRRKIEQVLRNNNAVQKTCVVFVFPYNAQRFPSATERVDLSALQSISLKDIIVSMPNDNINEMLRL